MALFKSNDPDKLIAAAETNLNRLKTELAESQSMAERYRAKAQQLNTDGGDPAGVERAELAKRAAEDRSRTNVGSIADVERQLSTHIATRDAAIDKKARHETGNEIEARLRDSGEIKRDFENIMNRIVDFTGWARPFTPDAAGLNGMSPTFRDQVSVELTMLQKIIGYHGASVMAGTAPANLKRPSAPVVQPVAVKPVFTTVFCLRSLKFTDPVSGKLVVVQQCDDALMPPEYARVALESRVCVRLDDPLRAKNKGSIPGHPDPLHAFDLDAAVKGPRLVADPIRASSTQPQPTVRRMIVS